MSEIESAATAASHAAAAESRRHAVVRFVVGGVLTVAIVAITAATASWLAARSLHGGRGLPGMLLSVSAAMGIAYTLSFLRTRIEGAIVRDVLEMMLASD